MVSGSAGEAAYFQLLDRWQVATRGYQILQACRIEQTNMGRNLSGLSYRVALVCALISFTGTMTRDYWMPLLQVHPAGVSFFRPLPPPREEQPYVNSLGMTFQWIPPGEFCMGQPEPRDQFERARPRRIVHVESGFWIAREKCPAKILELLLPRVRDYPLWTRIPDVCEGPDLTWVDAVEFCTLLAAREYENGLSRDYIYTLPTEAQWEYACTAGTKTYDCNDHDSSYHRDHPNAYGLLSVYGYPYEWCIDRWHPNFERGPLDERAWLTEVVTDVRLRVIRGGGFTRPFHRGGALQDGPRRERVWVRPVLLHKADYTRLVDESLLGWPPEPEAKTAAPSSRR